MIRFITKLIVLLLVHNTVYADSLIEYERHWAKNSNYLDDCFTTRKVMLDTSDWNNTYIPGSFGANQPPPKAPIMPAVILAATDRALGMSILIGAALFGGPVGIAAALGVGAAWLSSEFLAMADYCSGAFAYSADERVNIYAGLIKGDGNGCSTDSDGKLDYKVPTGDKASPLLTENDVPYIFHCDPMYDPTYQGSGWGAKLSADSEYVGKTWGYEGKNSEKCLAIDNLSLATGKNIQEDFMKPMVGVIEIGYFSRTYRILEMAADNVANTVGAGINSIPGVNVGTSTLAPQKCEFDRYASVKLHAGEYYMNNTPAAWGTIAAYAFYRIDPSSGHIQQCAAEPFTFFPVILGCTTVAAPSDVPVIDEFLLAFVADTRCVYLIQPRTDLNSLGNALEGTVNNPVKKFLKSEMHFTSTVVGCIKDMLLKIFLKSPTGDEFGPPPFFQQVQDRLRQMILAALTLYVALLGVKIMSSPEPPKRAEWLMYAVKFGMVLYFALGDAWYKVEGGTITGLYPALINASEEMASMFMQAQNINDPLRFCSYPYHGQDIFSENKIPVSSGLIATVGSQNNSYIITTVWDLIDCKVVNYLTLGTCNYSMTGLMSVWIPATAMFAGGAGFIFGLSCLLYAIFTLITVFRFAHIFILAMFTITILVFLSPIFFVFWLFEPTKMMFQQWFKMVMGYVLLPGLLFAFVSIMLATFDSIYYGDIDVSALSQTQTDPNTTQIEAMCLGVKSIYCSIAGANNWLNTCGMSIGAIVNNLTASFNVPGLFKVIYFKTFGTVWEEMLKLLLFAFLFYLFLDKVADFMAILVGVKDLGGMSKGIGALAAGPKLLAQGGLKLGGAAAGKAASKGSQGVGAAAGVAARGINRLMGRK